MMQITEDTPPDMLAGAMDLTVHLPTGRTVKMSVERSTPMMDLLVHITTAHHLQHSGHILQALSMAPTSGHTDRILPYKPNTPIGVLDIQHVKVVPKNRHSVTKNSITGHQPFESTFRLQVRLPRNQLYVVRVSQNVYLGDIMKKVCDEKKLDMLKYEFRHPGNLDEILDPKLTLSDYQITEVYLVSKGTLALSQAFSSNDIMALRKEEERKQMQARTGGGVFSLIFKRGKTSVGTGSLSSENRSISPSHSDDSRSITPPAVQPKTVKTQETTEKPKPPQRKRRVAPKPPQQEDDQRRNSTGKPASHISITSDVSETDSQLRKSENGLTICHSRNSSDSSGYHEPSVLSDHCNTSLPRISKSTINEVVVEELVCENKSKLNGNLSNMAPFSKSSASIAGRKKKAAPPPPLTLSTKPESVVVAIPEKASPIVDANITPPVENQGLGSATHIHTEPSHGSVNLLKKSAATSLNNEPTQQKQEDINSLQYTPLQEKCNIIDASASEKLDSVIGSTNTTNSENAASYVHTETPFNHIPNYPIKPQIETDLDRHQSIDKIIEDINDIDWEYQIPPPPSEFRDTNPDYTEVDNEEPSGTLKKAESGIISDCDSITGEDTKPMLNTLTLENLEKRKSLVYNREISTSLKVAQENSDGNDIVSKRSSMLNELEEVIQNGGSKSLARHVQHPIVDNTLPNFKISNYVEKTKISIYEDDSIRSNSEEIINTDSMVFKKPYEYSKCKTISTNNFYVKHHNAVTRSESFSSNMLNWKPHNPVQRSKSQVALNKIADDEENKTEDNSLTKSSSLFDVSGLQSLEVMRVIQNKLNTPSNSAEELDEQKKTESSDGNKSNTPKNENVCINLPPKQTESESTTNTKLYQYRGPPAINLSTWSERPKTKISLKEDTDYRISKTNSNITTVKFNGVEPPTKIIVEAHSNTDIISQPSVVSYRKPLGNINKIEKVTRPHSLAYETDFNISRVPIVRAVELKKSVTQITNSNEMQRVNSFAQNRPNILSFQGSTVGNDNTPRSRKSWNVPSNYSTLPSKINVAEPHIRSCNYTPNSNVPFSQLTLKRVESSRSSNNPNVPHPTHVSNRYSTGSQFVLKKNQDQDVKPPPPPMLHVTHTTKKLRSNANSDDPRDDLLNSIRNFGGLKGLRHVKV